MSRKMSALQKTITSCTRCPRLIAYGQNVARDKRKMYMEETYWGKPVPSFGDPKARLLIVGLAPAAHGAHRTGRMFTGDRSGLWLYRAIHRAGLSNQFSYERADDGLQLFDTWISATVHCAPPDNKPSREEKQNCLPYLVDELRIMQNVRVVLALGGLAYDGIYKTLQTLDPQHKPSKKPKFGHGFCVQWGTYTILCSYHPSQQNTFTKRLTQEMFDDVFEQAKVLMKD